jgi:C-terminal peptidase prc
MKFARFLALALVLAASSVTGSARVLASDDSLASAYAAILQGNYSEGRALVERARAGGVGDEQISRVAGWLKDFELTSTPRSELLSKTFDWNVEHARKAMAEAEKISTDTSQNWTAEERALKVASRTYLALNFAAQAQAYAPDEKAFAQLAWVQALRARCIGIAENFVKQENWSKAHSFYLLLERLNEKDKEAKESREKTARFVRLEVLYGEKEQLDRRLENVDPSLLANATACVRDFYYKKPDFKAMAEGALDSVIALCHTTKLYEVSNIFDGIANGASREYFLGKLEEARRDLQSRNNFDDTDFLKLFDTIRRTNKKSVELPESLLVIEFTEGGLAKLDQFTSMVWPAESQDFDKMMLGHFFGVGIQLGTAEDGTLKAVTALEGSPALEAGIQPDDQIVAVDGGSTKGWSTDKAVREITGEEGTEVVLTILRPDTGEKTDYKLKRRAIELTTIRGVNRLPGDPSGSRWNYMLDPAAGVAYVRLTGFNQNSFDELHKSLGQARKQGMKGLILDLRYNPGGLLDVAVNAVSDFVEKGEVVSTRGRAERPTKLPVSGDADYGSIPMVVLVNEGSASASEILAGALQDHNRAAILGERTFGKGSVQKVFGLDRGFVRDERKLARLKLTTALYYLPKGRSPHKQPDAEEWGVDPDWQIKLAPKEIAKVLERERAAFVIHNETKPPTSAVAKKEVDEDVGEDALEEARAKPNDKPLLTREDIKLLRSDPHKAADADPQLDTALLHLRVKLAGDVPWPGLAQRATKDDKP